MNLETKIIIYKFTPQVFTLTRNGHKKTYFRDQFVTCPTFRILGHGMSEIVGLLS